MYLSEKERAHMERALQKLHPSWSVTTIRRWHNDQLFAIYRKEMDRLTDESLGLRPRKPIKPKQLRLDI